ncbi:MAG: hypothetical protein QF473_35650 [Planctomycetota bacterium]|nr:hypothetical protein [Planctomycetota bacterium]
MRKGQFLNAHSIRVSAGTGGDAFHALGRLAAGAPAEALECV